jgi:hypothetical protein
MVLLRTSALRAVLTGSLSTPGRRLLSAARRTERDELVITRAAVHLPTHVRLKRSELFECVEVVVELLDVVAGAVLCVVTR